VIVVINYGAGNLRSITKAIEKIGKKATITNDPETIKAADAVVLPGVGAFETAIKNLKEVIPFLKNTKTPILGICLGMQLFATISEEGGPHRGLDIIPGRVVRFPKSVGKIPHMGWNEVDFDDHYLFEGIRNRFFYFVHSYYLDTKENVIAYTDYGVRFPSAVAKENYVGVQFHPEKSGKNGLKLLENFFENVT